MKILFSPLVWNMNDGFGRETIVPKTIECLFDIQDNTTKGQSDILIVDNSSNHPDTISNLAIWEQRPNVNVHRFKTNYGWSGRNFMIEYFMNHPEYEILVMMDQDIWIQDNDIGNRIIDLKLTDNDLHAYMLLVFDTDNQGEHTLPSGKKATIAREMLGGVHIIDRVVPQVIGGYACKSFGYNGWGGWLDVLYPRQLKYSGLLSYVNGLYLDPIRPSKISHHDPPILDTEVAKERSYIVNTYGAKFWEEQQRMANGGSCFYPIEYAPANEYR